MCRTVYSYYINFLWYTLNSSNLVLHGNNKLNKFKKYHKNINVSRKYVNKAFLFYLFTNKQNNVQMTTEYIDCQIDNISFGC